jgi:hypothetical protein
MSDDRAGSRVAAAPEGLALPDAAAELEPDGSGGARTEPDGPAKPDFTPVSVESLRLVLDSLRRLS